MQKWIGKWEFSKCKIATPKNFNLKLCTRDYIGKTTIHANFGYNRYSDGGFSPKRRNSSTLWLFLLSFFLGNAPRSNRWTDFHALRLKPRGRLETVYKIGYKLVLFTHKKSQSRLSIDTWSGNLEWLWTLQWPLFCVILPNSVALGPVMSK